MNGPIGDRTMPRHRRPFTLSLAARAAPGMERLSVFMRPKKRVYTDSGPGGSPSRSTRETEAGLCRSGMPQFHGVHTNAGEHVRVLGREQRAGGLVAGGWI
jgi:hypothetical protein